MSMLNLFAFGFVFLCCDCGLNVVLGVKASLTLGREEKPWVKGLVGLNIEVEKSFSWRGDSFHGVWAPLKTYAFLLFYGRYK